MAASGFTRRAVLAGLAAALAPLGPALTWRRPAAAAPATFRYLSARADSGMNFRASVFTDAGEGVFDVAVPARGHGAAVSAARREMVMFGRRPGTYALVFGVGDAKQAIPAAEGRSFAGHGFYSTDDALLYAVEDGPEAGVIGVYDVGRGFARVGEFSSGGIGPHQALLMPDGRTIAVCNGGIKTDPAFPRAKLNLDTMDPSLVLIEAASGRILVTARLPRRLHQLSIRHLDSSPDGTLAIGFQYEGPKGDAMPLAVLYRAGALVPLEMGSRVRQALRQYVGSIAFDWEGRTVAATSPVGGSVVFWDAAGGRFLGSVSLADVCGLGAAAAAETFIVTTGTGRIFRVRPGSEKAAPLPAPFGEGGAWDNHLLRISA